MIHFIDKTLFDARSVVSENYDWNHIKPIVELSQVKYIRELLGTDLYVAMQDKVQAYEDSETPIAAAYKTLLDDYIVPCLVWYVTAEMAPFSKFRIKPAGIFESGPENNTPIGSEDLKYFIDICRNNAEQYGQDMRNYIIENLASFPEYSTNGGLDKVYPIGAAYTSPFYTKGSVVYPERNDYGPIHD